MYEVTSDQELDQLIWSFIEDSCNPHDYLDYIRHTHSRPAEQEFAYELADSYWSEQNAPRQFCLAVTAFTVSASVLMARRSCCTCSCNMRRSANIC